MVETAFLTLQNVCMHEISRVFEFYAQGRLIMRAGNWELGAGNWELGAGNWELSV